MISRLCICASLAILVSATLVSCNKASPTEPTPVCSYLVSPGSSAIPSDGGTGTVTVTAPGGCSWTATASRDWITITAGASGSGSGAVAYSVATNASTAARSGAVTVAGQSHAITQQGRAPAACSYEVLPASANYTKDGGSGTFTVSAPADCTWTASSNAPWLVIDGSGQGAGTGIIAYTVARQPDIPERTATIAVADRTFTVRQSGDVALCQYAVAPVLVSPCMPAGTLTVTIATETSCPWTATPNASWLGVASGSSGNGSATLSISFSDNYDAPREGIVMVRWPTPTAGQNIRVAQAGCRYAVSRTAISMIAAGGTATFDVIQQSDPVTCGGATQDRCLWTARSEASWITITSSMPRSGDNPVAFTIAANDSSAPRTGTIVVRDQVVTVTQSGK
jgi:Putative binding domain, N-terminal/Viral BACON domain